MFLNTYVTLSEPFAADSKIFLCSKCFNSPEGLKGPINNFYWSHVKSLDGPKKILPKKFQFFFFIFSSGKIHRASQS